MDQLDSTPSPPPRQSSDPPFLAGPWFLNRDALNCCPSAQTLTAWDANTSTEILIVLPCKRWTCRICAARRTRQLALRTTQAAPNRMLTLTTDPKAWSSPETAYRAETRMITQLAVKLRRRFGPLEYFRCTEITKKGWPHFHLLIRSGFLPHAVVKDLWADLSGAMIVDLRQVKKTWEAYHYVTKYLAKLHKLPWTTRHIAWSKHFFPPTKEKPPSSLSLENRNRHLCHPAQLLDDRYRGCTVQRLSCYAYAITGKLEDEPLP